MAIVTNTHFYAFSIIFSKSVQQLLFLLTNKVCYFMVDINSYDVRGFSHYTFCLKVTPQEETIYDQRFS